MLMASAGRECTHIRSCHPGYYGDILILCSHLQIWMSHENPSIFWRQTNFYQTQYHVTLSLTNWCCWNMNNMTLNDHDTRNDSLIFCWCIWLMLEQSLCFIIFKGMIIFCCKLVIIIWSWQLWIVLTKFLLFQHDCLAFHKKVFDATLQINILHSDVSKKFAEWNRSSFYIPDKSWKHIWLEK